MFLWHICSYALWWTCNLHLLHALDAHGGCHSMHKWYCTCKSVAYTKAMKSNISQCIALICVQWYWGRAATWSLTVQFCAFTDLQSWEGSLGGAGCTRRDADAGARRSSTVRHQGRRHLVNKSQWTAVLPFTHESTGDSKNLMISPLHPNIQGGFWKEELDASHSQGLKG